MTRAWLALCLGGAAAAGACVVEPEPELDEVAQALGCHPMTCGMNSPKLDKWGFHELEIYGQTNDEGFQLWGFYKNGQYHWPYVYMSTLYAWDYSASTWIWGSELVGGDFVINHASGQYVIRIQDVGQMYYPVPDWTADPIETYYLEWKPAQNGIPSDNVPWTNVCSGFPGGPGQWGGAGGGPGELDLDWWENWELLGQNPLAAVLYQGERIYGDTFTVDPYFQYNWFNIGCAGHTVSKLHLTRNTIASGYGMPWADRQATLKMLAADYCPSSDVPFTVSGQRLVWRDPYGIVDFFRDPQSLEARWNENGAICLDKPRMLKPTTLLGESLFTSPDVVTQILDHCGYVPPSCTDGNPHSWSGELRVSGNP
jgi:hypothetical protein